jgi:hypothetical protein
VAAPASAGDDENYKVSEGLGVYIGVLPAALIKGHPTTHPEATMHGGVPSGARKYHLVIAVFDAASGDRVENAKVAATVSELGHVAERRFELEPMRIEGSIIRSVRSRLLGYQGRRRRSRTTAGHVGFQRELLAQ